MEKMFEHGNDEGKVGYHVTLGSDRRAGKETGDHPAHHVGRRSGMQIDSAAFSATGTSQLFHYWKKAESTRLA